MSKKTPETTRAGRLAALVETLAAEVEQARQRHNAAQAVTLVEPQRPPRADQLNRLAKAANEDALDGGNRADALRAEFDRAEVEHAERLAVFRKAKETADEAAEALAILQSRLSTARADLSAEVKDKASALRAASFDRYREAVAEFMRARCEVEAILSVALDRPSTGGFALSLPSYGCTEFPDGLAILKDTGGAAVGVSSSQTAALIASRATAIRSTILGRAD
jgi:hypothetical protein